MTGIALLKKQNTAKIRRKKSCTRKPKKKGRSLTEKTIENEKDARTKPRFYRTVAPEKKVKLGVPRMTHTRPLRHIRFLNRKEEQPVEDRKCSGTPTYGAARLENTLEHEIFRGNTNMISDR